MKVITFSGIDGSGKSTVADTLTQKLEAAGKKVYRLHAVEYSIANKLSWKKKKSSAPVPSVTSASEGEIRLRRIALIIDLWRYFSFYKRLRKRGYDYIISDRYFFDMVINIRYLAHEDWLGQLETFIPLPHCGFLMDIAPEVVKQRDRAPEQSLEYLNKKSELLHDRAKIWELHTINANQSPEQVFTDVWQELEQREIV
jgi:thymidylate kinase